MPTPQCPDCGGEIADGPCPRCLIRLGLDGLGTTPGSLLGDTQPVADRPGSVLATLAATVGAVPHVLLRETAIGEHPSPLFRPMPDARDESLRYRIDGEIARGGMGAVLRGRDPDLGRDVAIKVLRDDLRGNADLVRRFVEEAQIGGQLQHPGVVPIYELGTFADRRPFFAMKLVKGQTLAEQLADRSTPADDLPRFLATFAAITQTMAYAHTRGVIHRDLKPSNVMVGSFGEVQVMDWGLAKVLARGGVFDDARAGKEADGETLIATARSGSDADLSHAGSVLGTPSYMPPEQARGETDRIDERADVFALGSILAEILTGSPAYSGRSSREILVKAAKGDAAEALARLDACGAEADLRALAKDCLAAEPDDRPRDATVVADRITGYLDGVQERVHAAIRDRAVAEARAVEERRRRRLQLGLAAAVLGMVGLGAGGFAWNQRQRAETERVRADRLTRAASQIDDALAEAQRLRGEAEAAEVEAAPARWALALAAAERAVEHVTQGDSDEFRTSRADVLRRALRSGKLAADDRLARRRIDVKLLADLEAARAGMGIHYNLSQVVTDYAAAFLAAGLDIAAMTSEEAGRWVAGRSEPGEMIVYLDDWAWVLRRSNRPKASVDQIAAVARAADPDPWRNRLRTLYLNGGPENYRDFIALAGDPSIQNQPASSLVLLALHFGPEHNEDRIRVLRLAQRQHPNDFWSNVELAQAHRVGPGPEPQQAVRRIEAIRYWTAAAALRPGSFLTHSNLAEELARTGQVGGAVSECLEAFRLRPKDPQPLKSTLNLLKQQNKLEEAVAAIRDAVQSRPDVVHLQLALAAAMYHSGRYDEAIAAHREAVRIDPGSDFLHYILGIVLQRRGKLDEAIAENRHALRLKPDGYGARSNLGDVLALQGKLDEAIAEYRHALRIKPDHRAAHIGLGDVLARQGKHAEAIAEYRRAFIGSNPDNAAAFAELGSFLRDRGRLDEAVAAYRDAIRIDPGSDHLHYNLGNTLRVQGKLAEAESEYRKAIGLKPDGYGAHGNLGDVLALRGELGEAEHEYRTVIRLNPEGYRAHGDLGLILARQGNPADAEAEYREALRIKPDYDWAHYSLGNALRDQGKFDDAIAEFDEVIRLKPTDHRAHSNIGQILEAQGKLDEAVAKYRETIQHKPDDYWVIQRLSSILTQQGKAEAAAAELRRAIGINPASDELHYTLGNILRDQGKTAGAIAEYREAIGIKPNNEWLRISLGNILRDQGKPAEAASEYREAMRIKPDSDGAHIGLGNTLKDQGKLDEAIAEYHTAIRINPKNALPHANLGDALARQGKFADAEAEYREALRIHPNDDWTHHGLGNALRDQGKPAEAEAEYREALRINPKYHWAHADLGYVLELQAKPEAAIEAYREAIRLRPDVANYCIALGLACRSQGEYAEALEMLRKGHELGIKLPGWVRPSASWVAETERLAALSGRLPALLNGTDRPGSNAERIDFATMCYYGKRPAAAARLYAEALEADSKLGNDLSTGHRYNAACAAALAGTGPGKDEPPPDEGQKSKLRAQALGWLRSDLRAWVGVLENGPGPFRANLHPVIQHWKGDPDLAGVRDAEGFAKLPEPEREAWRALWADVDALLRKATGEKP